MPAMVWCVDASLGLRVGLVLLTSASFNSLLKATVGQPLPVLGERPGDGLRL